MNEPQFWMVWNPHRDPPKHRHESPQQAKVEAERLAREHPGNRFYVLQAVGFCSRNEVSWTTLDDADIPF